MTIQINEPTRLDGVSLSDFVPSTYGRKLDLYTGLGKRVFDIMIVLLTAPVTIPLMLFTAFLVARDGGSPIYVQKRIGKNGRIFNMYKLRTMVSNADERLAEYLSEHPQALNEWTHSQKLRHDPRVTRIGAYLRKCSLDELPQLINVFLGDMALIGPRPMMIDQENMYPGRAYYWMRPGISGLWQVTERNESAFSDRARYDDKYFYNMSFANDCKIIAKTFVVVVRGTGY
ncbi:sugar transferase [Sedimentitalea todarodis]|uniref:Sugar transferase n=1 Tax=Sedimentitalea todarodis TaxID=1631240 RepID=A0ABU3VIY3_9RHOB|nr:sugar transferase [Sedimentitalea todarodis]MDU9006139.1 sugar transferase [Sedimentitalea todarodis]